MFSVWLLPADSLPQFKMSIWAAAWQNQQKWPVHPAKTQISLGILTSSCYRKLWSDWEDAQADLRLCRVHVILLVLSCTCSYCTPWTFYFQYTWHILCLKALLGQNLQVVFHHCLRNRSVLVVNCWVIIHCLEVQVIYLLTTDRQTVNYYSTIHALELTYYDCNTQDRLKKQLYRSDSSNIPPLNWRNPVKDLTVMQAFTCFSNVYNVQKRRYTVYHQGDLVDGKDDIIKWHQIVTHFRPVNCCGIEHDFLQLAL